MREKNKHLSTIILAAGKGTRMKSDLAKVLHRLREKPLLDYSVAVARQMCSEKIVVVIGHQADLIRETYLGQGLIFVEQREQLGTGHAVLQARNALQDYEGKVLILCGDVPLLKLATLEELYKKHVRDRSVVTVMTTILDDPGNYGRVVKDDSGQVIKIVEQRDASDKEKMIREINTGIYCADCRFLFEAVAGIKNTNVQKEYYLTDIIAIAREKRLRFGSFIAADPLEVMGINTPEELVTAARLVV